MRQDILDKIKEQKLKYAGEGFIILGVFGSFARGEETSESDLDLLFEIDDVFLDRNSGWKACGRLEDIKKEISRDLGRHIDMTDRDALDDIGRRFILPEVVYVV
ncbi:MAG: hypothetical protein APR62_10255 [Smithella sp. SDB]|nr:MAG: hypothetical protein APR62_10255 [Smithella sp. SDB]